MDAGERGIATLAFQKQGNGANVPFRNSITGKFMICQDRLETNYCSYSPTQKIQNGFL